MSECVLCATDPSTVLWQDGFCRVIWVDEPAYPGFCRVILDAHVREMTDLSAHDQQRLMSVVFAVESVVREVCRPDKINLASLGNMVPHVHWHVIPRWEGDRCFPDAIWAAARREGSTPVLEDLRPRLSAILAAKLKTHLSARLGPALPG